PFFPKTKGYSVRCCLCDWLECKQHQSLHSPILHRWDSKWTFFFFFRIFQCKLFLTVVHDISMCPTSLLLCSFFLQSSIHVFLFVVFLFFPYFSIYTFLYGCA